MEIQKNKIIPLTIILLAMMSVGIFAFDEYQVYKNQQEPLAERNYKAEVILGVAPNMETRLPTETDIDTELNLQTPNGQVYRLIESRDFITFGKTFVVRIK